MLLPGRLKDTTLGDVLGTVFRARATGTLVLSELRPSAGRKHSITLEQGRIVAIESSLGPSVSELLSTRVDSAELDGLRIGEALLRSGRVSSESLRGVLHHQLKARIDALFCVTDAEIRFRVPRPASDDETRPLPLSKEESLVGRPRAKPRTSRTLPSPNSSSPSRARALAVLGLSPDASRAEIQSAFRRLAAAHHPDRNSHAGDHEKSATQQRFAELSRAFHELTG